MKDKTEKQLMVETLLKLIPDDMRLEDILYSINYVFKERERKRNTYKPTGRPTGRPKKGLSVEQFPVKQSPSAI